MSKNTIVGKGYLNVRDQKVSTAAAITPGHLVERTSAGLVQKHSTAGGPVENLFALEDDFQGKGIADAYAVSVPIMLWHAVPGERVYAIAGGTIAIGDFLTSNGDGTLVVISSAGADEGIVGVAVEAASAAGRFMVEIV